MPRPWAALVLFSLVAACEPAEAPAAAEPEARIFDGADAADTALDDDTAAPPDAPVEGSTGQEMPGCQDCMLGCCGDHCCALDPASEPLTSVADGQGDVVTPASAVFDTARDCHAGSVLGECTHVRLDEVIVACVCRAATVHVNGTLTVLGPDVLVLLAADVIAVEGTLDVSAVGPSDGPGGGWRYDQGAPAREGGKGGSFGSPGGGSDERLGLDDGEVITAGCRGQGSVSEPALGGGRGGAVQLSAGGRIVVTGQVRAHGGGGGGGADGGGGGGSGGTILIEAPEVVLTGSVMAHGGGGGGGGGDRGRGADGDDGDALAPARGGPGASGSGCEAHGFVAGGDGGAGAYRESAAVAGRPGASVTGCETGEAWVAGGGGGGGDGRIRIRSLSTCQCEGEISPAARHGEIRLR